MDGPGGYHIKPSEKEKRQIAHDITYMLSFKNYTNGLIYQTETKSETQKTDYSYQRGRAQVRTLGLANTNVNKNNQ